MQLLVWEERFGVGVREFDQHHKILFEMINSIIIAKETNSGLGVIRSTVEQLHMYTIFHFTAEEAMMEYFKFDGLEEHRREHQKLIRQVAEYQSSLDTAEPVSVDEIFNFLAGWVLDHTLGMDQLYGPFLRHRVE